MINNKVLNIKNIKKRLIKNFNLLEEKSMITLNDLYVNEIINKCEILIRLENQNIDYENFAKFDF